MATYTTLSPGMSGSDVKKLQQALVKAGYDVGPAFSDGIYGEGTKAAVKAYQKANGLTVDGLAGEQTLGLLYGTSTKTPATTQTSSAPKYQVEAPKMPDFKDFSYEDFSYKDYEESDTVKQAQAMLQQQLAQKPGSYQSQWQTQLNDIIGKIMNREKFSYDLNGDALYQQYKDQYVKQGQMAMQDAMGQAAAMTGGYGNSYAQSVGQQTYQGYLQQLNDRVPELYQLALSQYNQEGQDLINKYALLGEQENLDYGRHRDSVSDYYTNLDYLTGRYDTERDVDYNKWANDRNFQYGQYADKKNYAHQDHMNAFENQWKQTEFDQAIKELNTQLAYQQDRDKVSDEQWQKQFDLAKNQASSGGGSGSGSSGSSGNGGGGGYDNGALTTSEVKQIQAALGIPADGKWGEQSKAASGGLSAAEAYTAWKNGTLKAAPPSFSGKTYTDAVKYLEEHVPGAASSIMTASEWKSRKNSYKANGQGGTEVKNFDSYQEYLAAIVQYLVEKN